MIRRRREGGFEVVECNFSDRAEPPSAAAVLLAAEGEWRGSWLLTGREAWKLAQELAEAALMLVSLADLEKVE